jgi:asparagine synthetase B (glutamine-hydrolysing)
MAAHSFLGAMLPRTAGEELRASETHGRPGFDQTWTTAAGTSDLYLRAQEGRLLKVYEFGPIVLMVKGYVLPAGSYRLGDPSAAAEEIVRHYRERGELPVDRLEGSYSLSLLDGEKGRVLLYRGLLANALTYYTEARGGLLFAHNLADLIDASDRTPEPNAEVLPSFFLTRYVFGRGTLAQGYFRLMPGEMVRFDENGLTRAQVQTLADMSGSQPIKRDAAECVEATMLRILDDCARLDLETTNLLSGGVDSSYIQAAWNRVFQQRANRTARSYSASLAHARTRPDDEYARSAAAALGVNHTLIPIEGPYARMLMGMLSATAEAPNHVQTVYFAPLARAMVSEGAYTALCGEGADGLFGVGTTIAVQYAQVFRRIAPLPLLRSAGKSLARAIGWQGGCVGLELADYVDDLANPAHPINEVSVFADLASMRACFGDAAVAEASAARRGLVDQYEVRGGVLEKLHAAGFLGEAVDTAALWTELFNGEGADMFCPFLDSRMVRVVMNIDRKQRFPFREPKALLKRTLARRASPEIAYRQKRGFGQPIFEWMAPGGQLRELVDSIGDYGFVKPGVRTEALRQPNWFLYTLLCYDLWHKLFISKTIPRSAIESAQPEPALASTCPA